MSKYIVIKIWESFLQGSSQFLWSSPSSNLLPKISKKMVLVKSPLISIGYDVLGKFFKEALRVLRKSLWQSLRSISRFWEFEKLLELLVNLMVFWYFKWVDKRCIGNKQVKSMRLPSCEQVGFSTKFVRLETSLAPDKWFDEFEPNLGSSIFMSPARRMLSYLLSILFKVIQISLKKT